MLSCKQSAGAVSCAEDAHFRSYARRYGPASDAQFLRSIADKTPGRDDVDGARQMRHVYLKSYVLVTKDDDAKEANHAIRNKTRRAVVGKYLVLLAVAAPLEAEEEQAKEAQRWLYRQVLAVAAA